MKKVLQNLSPVISKPHTSFQRWTTALGYDGLELEMNLTLDDDVPLLEEVRFRWSLRANHALEQGEEKLQILEEISL